MKSIDIAKFVAALWVVALHAQPLANYPLSNFIVIDTLGQLAVPFFFIASAYFFFRKPADASRVRHYLQRMGLLHWEAARRYAFLRPFAWLHTVFRYAGKGTRLLARSPDQVRSQVSDGMKINTLLHRLGLD